MKRLNAKESYAKIGWTSLNNPIDASKTNISLLTGFQMNSVADPGGLWGVHGSLIGMKNTDLNVYFYSKVPPFTESWIRPRNCYCFQY